MVLNHVTSGLENALNKTSLRAETLSQNIANVDTPNYKAKTVNFKETLDHQLKANRSDTQHMPFSMPDSGTIVQSKTDTAVNNNGNNVDIDRDMANLAKTQVKYQALIEQLNAQFKRFNTVLRGGG